MTALPKESPNPLYQKTSQSQAIILQIVVHFVELKQRFPRTKRCYKKNFYLAKKQIVCHRIISFYVLENTCKLFERWNVDMLLNLLVDYVYMIALTSSKIKWNWGCKNYNIQCFKLNMFGHYNEVSR